MSKNISGIKILFLTFFAALIFSGSPAICAEKEAVFSSRADKEEFAKQVSGVIARAWETWQNGLTVGDVEVNGSRGIISPGGLSGPVLTNKKILRGVKAKNIPKDKMRCLTAVTGAVADCMREWQRGYRNDNVPFPEGSSSSFSLAPCSNVPVAVSSGFSYAERKITEEALYDYMVYRGPGSGEDVSAVFKAAAKAFCLVFREWKENCFIEGVIASGGMAPAPAPMGTGPGPVRGAKGAGGKLTGAYFDGQRMYEEMVLSLGEVYDGR
jgi:hypothetical protein